MKEKFILLIILISSLFYFELIANDKNFSINLNDKPYSRYWWFASLINKDDIRYNLDWLKSNGFGGVEIAWVYPLNRFNPSDTSYTPRQEWLSPEWGKIVEFAIKYADSIGMGCDLTFGTLWPFGDTYVKFDEATQKFGDSKWRQEIKLSWQHPKVGYVVDHLNPKNYQKYFDRLLKAFPRPKTKFSTAYFIDSWEVETEKLWCDGFDKDFKKRFGYDITPYMDSIYKPENSMFLYDYMSLISDKVLKFYENFDKTLNSAGILSRGQVSGAPCDLISGYAKLDIPEGESMLFEPEFCAIPASAALLSSKQIVSSETFTCIYGWPRDYIREEQTADLKLVADALFANGVNHIIWHGKAHNHKNSDSVNFYATTHIGDKSLLKDEIIGFNQYLQKVSSLMKKGVTFSEVAVYLPTEDAWVKGVMPKEKQFKWAWGYYEMRYVYFPEELSSFSPAWINYEFLQKGKVKNGNLIVGDAEFHTIYIDAEYLDYKVVKRLNELAKEKVHIVLKRKPKEPGYKKHKDYDKLISEMFKYKNVSSYWHPQSKGAFSLVNSDEKMPPHWIRKDLDTFYILIANPKSKNLKFPLEYGQSLQSDTMRLSFEFNKYPINHKFNLVFPPNQSKLIKITKDNFEEIEITFVPKTPIVKKRPENYEAPWLVK
ncbi:MAG: glycosyl hydrolase [Candidatus Kapabacteria bacterium]|nr:glycosyl hydrolase [Candidatus Kapabacteria bacterium]